MHYLYSFRRCPYAIRARMALSYAEIRVGVREVKLSDKPVELIQVSPKATVPVLVLDSGEIIDESLDIMLWAIKQSDPKNWLSPSLEPKIFNLIHRNDFEFKPLLDNYKYPQSSKMGNPLLYREQALPFLSELNTLLSNNQFLLSNTTSLTDIAVFPFIRQFCMVDKEWFMQSPFTKLTDWLTYFLTSPIFLNVMQKYSPWNIGNEEPILN